MNVSKHPENIQLWRFHEHALLPLAGAQLREKNTPLKRRGVNKKQFWQGSFTNDSKQYGFYFHFIVQFFFVTALER